VISGKRAAGVHGCGRRRGCMDAGGGGGAWMRAGCGFPLEMA